MGRPATRPPGEHALSSQVCLAIGINHSTLAYRLAGRTQSRSLAYTHLQTLTAEEEVSLVHFIRRTTHSRHPVRPARVRVIAHLLVANRLLLNAPPAASLPSLGHNWLQKFIGRHPSIRTMQSRALETARFKAGSMEALTPWFTEHGALLALHDFQACNIYNMDETGFQLRQT